MNLLVIYCVGNEVQMSSSSIISLRSQYLFRPRLAEANRNLNFRLNETSLINLIFTITNESMMKLRVNNVLMLNNLMRISNYWFLMVNFIIV